MKTIYINTINVEKQLIIYHLIASFLLLLSFAFISFFYHSLLSHVYFISLLDTVHLMPHSNLSFWTYGEGIKSLGAPLHNLGMGLKRRGLSRHLESGAILVTGTQYFRAHRFNEQVPRVYSLVFGVDGNRTQNPLILRPMTSPQGYPIFVVVLFNFSSRDCSELRN